MDAVLKELRDEKIVTKSDDWTTIPFYRPGKSKECEDGYKGRVGIHEILKMTPTVRELIMKSETALAIQSQAKSEGMLTMIEDGIFKAAQGQTTIEEVLRVISE